MNLKVFTVPLDIKQPTSASDEWVVVAGDNGNEIHVVLTDDGEPVDLSGKTILAIFSKPDGSTSEQDSWGNGITVSGEDNNVVVIDLWPSSFGTGRLHIGLVKCEIQVYYGDSLENLVTSANFTFKVRRAILNNETVEQTSEYPILSELIRQVTEIGQGVQPDWNVDDPTQSGYIKNKPSIPETAEDVGALPETTTPADIGALPDSTTPADIGAESQRLQFEDTVVAASAFVSDVTYQDFPYRAAVTLTGVTEDMTPEVVFNVADAMSGIFAPVIECYSGGIYLYASEVPGTDITIPTIICWNAVDGVNGGNGSNGGGIGGGGGDLLNGDGIIKKQYLPDGYPYIEIGEILPSAEYEVDPESTEFTIVAEFALSVGGEYTVTWNNVEYDCVGQSFDMDGVSCVALGNLGVVTGGDATEEPFIILNLPDDVASTLGAYGAVSVLDSSETVTMSISGEVVTKISAAYLPEIGGVTYLVDGLATGSLRSTGSVEEDIANDYVLGAYSVSFGYNTKASGTSSFAEGLNTTASGDYSHAEGYDTTASGVYSHAEGSGTTASGGASHAEGYRTTASGVYSHAEGSGTTASGGASHAEGSGTEASGYYSHAEGYYVKASSDCQHVQGKNNVEDSSGKYAHIVGNGSADNARSNAHTLDWSGNAWFAGTVEGTALILKSSTSGSTKRFMITVDDSGTLSATEIV